MNIYNIAMCCILMDSSQRALQTNEILTENRKIYKRVEWHEYWSQWNVLYINGFDSTSSTNYYEAFFKFLNHFLN